MGTTEPAVWLTDKRWHDDYPELGRDPIPIEPYISDAEFELEREHIFGKVWLPACRVEAIADPGDFLVKEVEVCRTSVIVTRGRDGDIRAFHNMCSHRGNKVAYDEAGNTRRLVCRFHGWAFDLEGDLRLVPDEDNWFEMDKSCHGLTPVAVGVWEGFVFINLDPEPAQTLHEYLGEAATTLEGYPFADLSTQAYSYTTVFEANWKLVKDAFQEVAHVPFQHHGSLPDAFVSKENPYTHFIDMRLYGPHGRASLFGSRDHVVSPAQALAYSHVSTIEEDASSERSTASRPVGLNPTGSPDWAYEMTAFFPSFLMVVTNDTYFTNHFLPLDINRTLVETTSYYPKPQNLAERFSHEYLRVFFRDVFLEDGRQVEETQAMLRSGAKTHFVLKDEELFIRASLHEGQRMIAAGIASGQNGQA